KPIVAAGIIEPNLFLHLYNSKNTPRLGAQNSSIGALFPTRKSYGGHAVPRACQARRGLKVEAVAVTERKPSIAVKAIVSVKPTFHSIPDIGFSQVFDFITNWRGRTLLLELVSAEAQPRYARLSTTEDGLEKYEADLVIPSDFGEVGAILVENELHKEMHLIDILLNGLPFGSLQFPCNSWVQPKSVDPEKRVFFTTKSYLPSQTPSGLKRLREKDLEALRGDGTGERKNFERIYDYSTYDDLGNPDKNPELARPVLGGSKEFPYPRRCRTEHPPTKIEINHYYTNQRIQDLKGRSTSLYVPRDEQFSEVKQLNFNTSSKPYIHVFIQGYQMKKVIQISQLLIYS
ncbi:Linoleate 13S-lipoxygenase 2-1 chloroplastic, partial [Bienertia sinuspersici]